MTDEIDRAEEISETLLAADIQAVRAAGVEAEATGKCLFCGEKMPHGRRWCDADCRDGWQRERDAASRRKEVND